METDTEYEEILPDFGNQYADFKEEIDPRLPKPRMKELPIVIYTDANHGQYDHFLSFVLMITGWLLLSTETVQRRGLRPSQYLCQFVGLEKKWSGNRTT